MRARFFFPRRSAAIEGCSGPADRPHHPQNCGARCGRSSRGGGGRNVAGRGGWRARRAACAAAHRSVLLPLAALRANALFSTSLHPTKNAPPGQRHGGSADLRRERCGGEGGGWGRAPAAVRNAPSRTRQKRREKRETEPTAHTLFRLLSFFLFTPSLLSSPRNAADPRPARGRSGHPPRRPHRRRRPRVGRAADVPPVRPGRRLRG